jgi:predicted Zn-ribbon and HTH transcriptional regulator
LESDQRAGGFGKSTARRVKYTVRLRRETEIQMHLEALKMGFCRAGDFLPIAGLCQIASIWNQTNGAGGFGKSTGRRVKYTVRLRRETEVQTHLEALKMGFRRAGGELPCEGDDRKSGGDGCSVLSMGIADAESSCVYCKSW